MMKNVVRLKTAIIVWIAVFVLSISTTFAIITWSSSNTLLAGKTMCFDILYTKGQDINFGTTDENGLVINGMTASLSFDETKAAITSVTFQRKPNCGLYGLGTITANITTNSTTNLSLGGLKYRILDSDESLVSEGSIKNQGDTVIYKDFLINENITYTIYFWLDANYIDNTYLDATFTGTIESSGISTTQYGEIDEDYEENIKEGTIYYQLASNAVADNVASTYVTSSTGINFSIAASDTNGKGIYTRAGTQITYPIHYYRGNIDNNNLIFADFCWKIVRTTETGGIKLIYNGTPTDGTCNNTGEATQIGTSAFNTGDETPETVGYMYGASYEFSNNDTMDDTYYFGNDVTYSNGTYTLVDTISGTYDEVRDELKNHHYTCFSTGTTCTSIYYVYYTKFNYEYLKLTDGKKIENALTEMLDYNTNSSTIKGNKDTEGTLDYWYYTNIEQTRYNDYVEDTIWCNDRSISSLAGFEPNGGNTDDVFHFGIYERVNESNPSLICKDIEDSFTVEIANGNGDLDYPVGLITHDEAMLAGIETINSSNINNPIEINTYLNNGLFFATMTPNSFVDILDEPAAISAIYNNYFIFVAYTDYTEVGVRPSISLKPGTKISEGDGTANNPYQISQ